VNLGQKKRVHFSPEKYLNIDEYEKRKMLEKLLSNATFKNKSVVQYIFKNPFQILAMTPKNIDLPQLLPARDSFLTGTVP